MSWIDNIKNAITDTGTLDAVTATGSIQPEAQGKGERDFENIAESSVRVVAFSHSQRDCDTFMFVKSNLTNQEQ